MKSFQRDSNLDELISDLASYSDCTSEIMATITNVYDIVDFAAYLRNFHHDKSELIANCFMNYNNKKKHPVKNIAIYFHCMQGGGIERGLSIISPMFVNMGYHVILLVSEMPDAYPKYVVDNDIPVLELPMTRSEGSYLSRGNTLRDVLIENKIDVFMHETPYNEFAFYDFLICKHIGISIIASTHELFSQFFAGGWTTKYSHIRMADAINTVNDIDMLFWKNYHGNVHMIPNSLSFDPKRCERKGGNVKEILWIGRFDALQKNPFDAIDIFKTISEMDDKVVMRIVGRDYLETSIADLRRYAESNMLTDRLIIEGWTDNIEDVYARGTLLLLTSAFESFSRVLGEAFCFGLPVVMYELPYLELLKGNHGYRSVMQGNKVAAAKAIMEIINDDDLYAEMSISAKKAAIGYYEKDIRGEWKGLLDSTSVEHKNEPNVNSSVMDVLIQHANIGISNKNQRIREKESELKRSDMRTTDLLQRNMQLSAELDELRNSTAKAIKNVLLTMIKKVKK